MNNAAERQAERDAEAEADALLLALGPPRPKPEARSSNLACVETFLDCEAPRPSKVQRCNIQLVSIFVFYRTDARFKGNSSDVLNLVEHDFTRRFSS